MSKKKCHHEKIWKSWKGHDKICEWCGTKIKKSDRHYRVELDDGCYYWICYICEDDGRNRGGADDRRERVAMWDAIHDLQEKK